MGCPRQVSLSPVKEPIEEETLYRISLSSSRRVHKRGGKLSFRGLLFSSLCFFLFSDVLSFCLGILLVFFLMGCSRRIKKFTEKFILSLFFFTSLFFFLFFVFTNTPSLSLSLPFPQIHSLFLLLLSDETRPRGR